MKTTYNEKYSDQNCFKGEPLQVFVREGNLEGAIRIFRQKVLGEDLIKNYRKRQRYEKPSDKNRREKREMEAKAFNLKRIEEEIRTGEFDKKQKLREKKKLEKIAERSKKFQGNG